MIEIRMIDIEEIFKQNKIWAQGVTEQEPDFFTNLAKQQNPEILWIGCSDSRVPANQIVNQEPGSIFVHRNIANVVVHSDLNCLSVIQFAVEVLKVEHIIVCGHYGCGGVNAALDGQRHGLIDNWLGHIRDIKHKYAEQLGRLDTQQEQHDLLCRLNVQEQVANVSETTILRSAWKKGQNVAIHGWVYSIINGLLDDLKISVNHSKNK